MLDQCTVVLIRRERIDKVGLMLPMQAYLVIDRLFIGSKLIRRKAVVAAFFRDSEVLQICLFITLPNSEVRRVWLTCEKNIIFIMER